MCGLRGKSISKKLRQAISCGNYEFVNMIADLRYKDPNFVRFILESFNIEHGLSINTCFDISLFRKDIHRFLKEYPSRWNWVFCNDFMDIFRMQHAISIRNGTYRNPSKGDTPEKYHDYLVDIFQEIETKLFNLPLPSKKWNVFDKREIEQLTLFYPHTNHELLKWGRITHTCIGTYIDKILSNKSICFCLKNQKREIVWIGEIDVKTNKLVQFRGHYNAMPPPSLEEQLNNWFSTNPLEN